MKKLVLLGVTVALSFSINFADTGQAESTDVVHTISLWNKDFLANLSCSLDLKVKKIRQSLRDKINSLESKRMPTENKEIMDYLDSLDGLVTLFNSLTVIPEDRQAHEIIDRCQKTGTPLESDRP